MESKCRSQLVIKHLGLYTNNAITSDIVDREIVCEIDVVSLLCETPRVIRSNRHMYTLKLPRLVLHTPENRFGVPLKHQNGLIVLNIGDLMYMLRTTPEVSDSIFCGSKSDRYVLT